MWYTPEMNRELRRAVQNFNKKVKRLESKGVTSALLPSKESVRGLKLAYKNKRDLNRRLKELQSFTAKGEVRGNKYNVMGTNELFKYSQKQLDKTVNRRKARQRKLKSSSMKYKTVRDDAILNNDAKIKFLSKDLESVDVKTLQRLNRNALSREEDAKRRENFYNGYFKMFRIEAGASDYDYEKMKVIEKELRKLTPDQLLELKETDSTVAIVTDEWVDSEIKYSSKGAKSMRNKIDAIYEALPEIKGKYGIV